MKANSILGSSPSISTFDAIKRFDVGLGLRVGVEFKKKYSLSVSYDWGLLNSLKKGNGDIEDFEDFVDYEDYEDYVDFDTSSLFNMKHANLMISLGYKF